MSPEAGWLLQEEIVSRLRSTNAVGTFNARAIACAS